MAIKVGGMYAGAGAGELRMRALLRELQRLHGKTDHEDHVVDLAFCTYSRHHRPDYIDWQGVKAGPVGRAQKRFVVWIEVPPDLPDGEADREWLTGVLTEVADLIREHVPRRSKEYPVERLEREVLDLRSALSAGH